MEKEDIGAGQLQGQMQPGANEDTFLNLQRQIHAAIRAASPFFPTRIKEKIKDLRDIETGIIPPDNTRISFHDIHQHFEFGWY